MSLYVLYLGGIGLDLAPVGIDALALLLDVEPKVLQQDHRARLGVGASLLNLERVKENTYNERLRKPEQTLIKKTEEHDTRE
jgi:hypothetical protein